MSPGLAGATPNRFPAWPSTPGGNIYIAGTTRSLDFPANGYQTHPKVSNLYRVDDSTTRPVWSLPGDVLSISPDAQHPGTLWAGTSRGLFKSDVTIAIKP